MRKYRGAVGPIPKTLRSSLTIRWGKELLTFTSTQKDVTSLCPGPLSFLKIQQNLPQNFHIRTTMFGWRSNLQAQCRVFVQTFFDSVKRWSEDCCLSINEDLKSGWHWARRFTKYFPSLGLQPRPVPFDFGYTAMFLLPITNCQKGVVSRSKRNQQVFKLISTDTRMFCRTSARHPALGYESVLPLLETGRQ